MLHLSKRLLTGASPLIEGSNKFSNRPVVPKSEITPKKFNLDYEHHLKIRKQNLSPAIFTLYKEPLLICQGYKQYLWDYTGKQYLDFSGSIVTISVGHCHPKVSEQIKKQSDTLMHCTSTHLHPRITELAEKLTSKLASPLDTVYFVNSGSEANEMALMLARLYTGNWDFISLRGAYHGITNSLLGLTSYSTWRIQAPTGFGIQNTMSPDVYRGPWGGNKCKNSPVQALRECNCAEGYCNATEKYLSQLEDVLNYSTAKKVAGIILEPLQGVGAAIQLPKGYMKRAFELVRERGGICVADEVQTGFGRIGTHYWGYEHHGATPDIVVMAKGLGNGFPIAAVVTRRDIAAKLSESLHFNTFGGNALACTVGSTVLDIIDEEKLMENANTKGKLLLRGLDRLRDKYEFVGDVRGSGLMTGVDFVSDRVTKKPLPPEQVIAILEDCRDCGMILVKGGLNGSCLRCKPPLCVTEQDIKFALDVLEYAFDNHLNRVNQK